MLAFPKLRLVIPSREPRKRREMPSKNPFVLSFTAGGLLYHESIVLAEVYAACGQWDRASERVESQNLLQSRTASTAERKLREVRQRLQGLTDGQVSLLVEGSRLEQQLLLWLACCKRYQLLAEFAREVLRTKFLQLDFTIDRTDVDRFIDSKLVWHEELENLTETTTEKLKTVMIRMLRESELVSEEGVILPPLLTTELIQVIAEDSPALFLLFPVAEADVRRAAQ